MKTNELQVICYRADGTEMPINPETKKFDPPVEMPAEIHFEMLRIANLANGIQVELADKEKKDRIGDVAV